MSEIWKDCANAAMDRYACGDEGAFSELYDVLAPRLRAFLVRRTGDAAWTEDLVQQTFLQMHCARRHFVPGAAVTPWAFAIARRLLIDGLRKVDRRVLLDLPDGGDEPEAAGPEDGSAPDAVAGRRRLARRINEELARISESDRSAFELVKCHGLSMAEAAEVLGTTANAVKLRAFRAYEALRTALGAEVREELEGSR